VTREPVYSEQAARALDRLEADTDARLNDAVCDVIDLICDLGDTAEARREQMRTAQGTPMWKVSVRGATEAWVVLWWPVGDDAQIYYIGPL
jgi:hypothetical protein